LITEIPGEQAATVLQDLTEWATLNPEKPFKTYLEERPSAALQTLVATTVGVGGSTVISTSLEKATSAYAAKADQAERGEKIADVIANMNKLSAANKVRTRDAETFEEWISQVSEDSPIQNVYINAETLKQSGMDKQLQEIAPEIAEQVETAAAMGRDVQIPIADYMTKIAPTPLGDAMLDDLRAEGETMTRKEAREFIDKKSEELQAAADQMMQQKENDQKFIDLAAAHTAQLISKDKAVLTLRNRMARLGVAVGRSFPALLP
jgi:adenylate kinase